MKNIKYFIIVVLFTFISVNAFAQNNVSEFSQWVQAPYRLYRTQNMWAFIELETATGRMWQIHFDTSGNNRIQTILNSDNLAVGREKIHGRFTLHPTQNIFTFILHDQIDGRTWQVQWSNDRSNRLIIPIGE